MSEERRCLPHLFLLCESENATVSGMANRGTVDINAAYNNIHGETVSPPGPRFAAGDDLFDCSEGCSPLGVSTA